MGRLDGKVALITGGNAGIGEAIAQVFAQEGAAVVVTGRRAAELDRVVQAIQRAKGRALAVPGSVTDEAHARDAVARTVATFGGLHILVNNAGVGDFGRPLHEFDDAAWQQLFDVNVTGVFRFTRAAVPQLLAGGGGSIVNISSIASLVGIPMAAAYSATKGALDAMTRAIAIDYAPSKIRCNCINPGLVDTPMAAPLLGDKAWAEQVLSAYPMKRPGRPEEIAKLALYLASDESTWVTGTTFPIDGGMTAQ
ncbi:MAG: SDR family oxidoreductase [Nitrospiraceae bacterium]